MTQTETIRDFSDLPDISGTGVIEQVEQTQSHNLDVGVSEITPSGDVRVLQDTEQRLFSVIEGKRYTIDQDGQRDMSKDAKDPEVTELVAQVTTDFWKRNSSARLAVAEAKQLMDDSLQMVGDMLDMYDDQAKSAKRADGINVESNFSSMSIRFFEDTDGNLRAVYGRTGRSAVMLQGNVNGPVVPVAPNKSTKNWRPVHVEVTPPLSRGARFMLSSENVLETLEADKTVEDFMSVYNLDSEQYAAGQIMDMTDEVEDDEDRAVLFIDISSGAPVMPEEITPVGPKVSEVDVALTELDVPQRASLLSRFKAAARQSIHELTTKPKHKRSRFTDLGNSALSSQVKFAESIKKVGNYYKDEEKGSRRRHISYVAGAVILAGIALLETRGVSASHHLNDTHQQATNHLHAGVTTPKVKPEVTQPAVVAPKTVPANVVATPPAEVTQTVNMTPGDTIWNEANRSLVNSGNISPTNTQIYDKMLDIMYVNHISFDQARDLQIGTALIIPS